MFEFLTKIARGLGKPGESESSCNYAEFPEGTKNLISEVTCAIRKANKPPPLLGDKSLAECRRITDAAIAIFKTEKVPKVGLRPFGEKFGPGDLPHPSLVKARHLFEQASRMGFFPTPAAIYNFGVCLYHFDLFQSG